MKELLDFSIDTDNRILRLHLKAKEFLDNGFVVEAWKVLLI
ncbi:hypothetical protein [Sphingobacterium hungaricum]